MAVNGLCFDDRNVNAANDAQLYKKMLTDGILSGCAITNTGTAITAGPGYFIISGRNVQIDASVTTPLLNPIQNGYVQLKFTADMTKPESGTNFQQGYFSYVYSTTLAGFPALVQQDINDGGNTNKYELEFAVYTLVNGAVTALTRSIGPSRQSIIDLVYPVGAIYMSVNSANPAALFGGTWQAWGQGQVAVGVNPGDSDFNAAEKTGGEKTHQLTVAELAKHTPSVTVNSTNTDHTHSGTTSGVGDHNHALATCVEEAGGFGLVTSTSFHDRVVIQNTSPTDACLTGNRGAHSHTMTTGGMSANAAHGHTATVGQIGGDTPHNNMPPFVACYMWKRTA